MYAPDATVSSCQPEEIFMSSKPTQGYHPARRRFLKTSVLGAISAPTVISSAARASSGELNLLAWDHTVPDSFLRAFTQKTGIVVRQLTVGSNEEIINKMKATRGRGIDLICPTNTRAAEWAPLKLLQPFDFGKIHNLHNLHRNLLDTGKRDWNFDGNGPHWLPHIWGTEAIAWRTDMWQPAADRPSYGDLWSTDIQGLVMMQPHSGMLGVGLYLEAQGKLPKSAMSAAYRDEASMRKTWQQVTAFCVDNKAQIKLFWNDAQAQVNALLNEGVVAGQSWDGPAMTLRAQGEPIEYQAPVEGALAWVDGFALSANATNVPQAYAFLDYCFEAKIAGDAISSHGYNSAVIGAEQFADATYQQNFQAAYSQQDLENLWIWPSEPEWYASVRKEFRNQFVNA